MRLKTVLYTLLTGVSLAALTSCRSNESRFESYKEDHPTAKRSDFIRSDLIKAKDDVGSDIKSKADYYTVGEKHKQRTESVYEYHYGFSFGKLKWHWGYHDVDRANTAEENKQDSLAYLQRLVEQKKLIGAYKGYSNAYNQAAEVISQLAQKKSFDTVQKDDAIDSLDVETFSKHADALARIMSKNNIKLIWSRAAQPLPAKYEDAYKKLVQDVRRSRNTTVAIHQ